jgi:hypothetical protein
MIVRSASRTSVSRLSRCRVVNLAVSGSSLPPSSDVAAVDRENPHDLLVPSEAGIVLIG